jgi:myosin-crossreactive antigen
MNGLNEYNAKMCQSAHGLQNFASFFANQFCGNWQVMTTSQDVHDAFEFRRNAVKRDIESCSGLSDYQKAFYCKQSDRQLLWQEVFTSVLLRGMNRLR